MGMLLDCVIVSLAFVTGFVVGFGVSEWRALRNMEALAARFERHQRELLRETPTESDAAADGWADAWKDAAAEVRRHRRRGE